MGIPPFDPRAGSEIAIPPYLFAIFFPQPFFICEYAFLLTVLRDFGRLLPAFFRLLMLFTNEFFFVDVFAIAVTSGDEPKATGIARPSGRT